MNDRTNSGKPLGDKPLHRQRKPNARLRWHKANHREAWAGIVKMPPIEVGIYWRIILLQYINKAAHAFTEDAEMAQACHTGLKEYRRIRDKLIARGRLEVDLENGIYFDKRAMEEMIEAGFLSEEQIDRANKRWARARDGDAPAKPRVVVDNVRALTDEAAAKLAEVGLNSPLKSGSSTPPSQTQIVEDQSLSSLKCYASRVQNPDKKHIPTQSPVTGGRSPLNSGGPTVEPKTETPTDRAARLEEQKRRLREAYPEEFEPIANDGSDETAPGPKPGAKPQRPKPPADKKARRA